MNVSPWLLFAVIVENPSQNWHFFNGTFSEDWLNRFFSGVHCVNMKTELKTSQRLGGIGGGAHEVNRRTVMASQKIGQAGLVDFCASMCLPPPVTKKSFNGHLVQIEKHANSQMEDAAKRLFELVKKKQPENIVIENGVEIAEISVTVDGTWQKRGHSSKIGVVFVLFVLIGES